MSNPFVLKADTAHYEIRGSDVNLVAPKVSEAVELESRIPRDAKQAVIDFIESQVDNFLNAVNDVIIDIPDALMPYVDAILEIIRILFGWS